MRHQNNWSVSCKLLYLSTICKIIAIILAETSQMNWDIQTYYYYQQPLYFWQQGIGCRIVRLFYKYFSNDTPRYGCGWMLFVVWYIWFTSTISVSFGKKDLQRTLQSLFGYILKKALRLIEKQEKSLKKMQHLHTWPCLTYFPSDGWSTNLIRASKTSERSKSINY